MFHPRISSDRAARVVRASQAFCEGRKFDASDIRPALAELREVTGYIEVASIGEDDSCDSWQYWVHQWSAKRVDLLTDNEGRIILKRDPGMSRKPLDMLA